MNDREAQIITAVAHLKTLCDERGHELLDVLRDAALDHVRVEDELVGVFLCDPDESGGLADAYEASDPKSNGYHSLHADLWDNREKF